MAIHSDALHTPIVDRLSLLRCAMQTANLQACIIPTTDNHVSKNTPAYWRTLQWISGFTGSTGTVVVTLSKAGLWTDSRYFLQAEEQLQGSGIELFKLGLPNTLSLEEWLQGELFSGDNVGLDGTVYAASEVVALTDYFKKYNIGICFDFAPYDQIWENRSPLPIHPAFVLSEQFSGESARSKINRLLKELRNKNCDTTILVSLDMVAWLLNLRGSDIAYNPVCIAYAIVSEWETVLFISSNKLTPEVTSYLQSNGIIFSDYNKIDDYIRQLSNRKILVSSAKINYQLYQAIPTSCTLHEIDIHPVDRLKSIKNKKEISGIRQAMRRDGVVMVKFLYWIDKQMSSGRRVTELDVHYKLKDLRSKQDYFFSESFETIAGYGPHGAIVHYSATDVSNAEIRPEGLLLIDSGAQYMDGTTDITRTIAVGPVTNEMKRDYTYLLKGHIRLAMAKFPKGTVGMQLDVLARQFIWQEGQNYLHGTGHGVGHFLNVHEGPQNIHMNYNSTPLQPGMIISNEPGIYKVGRYGIRIENLLLTVDYPSIKLDEFYTFETLTVCPMDKRLIDRTLLERDDIKWLNDYHQKVYKQVSHLLTAKENEWLKKQLS